MCFKAAKCSAKSGRRYTLDWMYECLLIRIKSRATYEHLRKRNILPLPAIQTLSKYLKNIQPMYGFNEKIFTCMKEKAKNMPPEGRRGVILADEMKLSEAIHFDQHTMKFNGFVDLGDYTMEGQGNERGDHALVLMFQPFRGQWVQNLGAFLSKGCASSTVLHKLLLECTILLENHGFFVDGLTTDGATWNRAMWKKWGITDMSTSCEHPCDIGRRLWVFSDFSHLQKNFRNFVVSSCQIWTPDGAVELKHWEALLNCENFHGLNLKIAHNLSYAHIHPKYYQKMSVRLANEFFSVKVGAAMEIYKNHHPNLENCDSTIRFIKRVNALIEAMSSRSSVDALRFNSKSYKAIEDFLNYFIDWEEHAEENAFEFVSRRTAYGLKVTLKNALELMQFLTEKCNFDYITTARLNQDALETLVSQLTDDIMTSS